MEIHIRQLREDLTFEEKEDILRGHFKPPDKTPLEKSKRTAKSGPSRKSRRRDPELPVDDEGSDDETRSVSTMGTVASNVSKHSDAISKHSGRYTTMDPDGKDAPMQSPIQLQSGRFIHRREHILLLSIPTDVPLLRHPTSSDKRFRRQICRK